MRQFKNDYSEGAAPQILDALIKTNDEQCVGYTEGDPHCEHARELIRQACKRPDAAVEFCIGGTSANIVGITGMLRDWEGVICTKDGHINVHETGSISAAGRTILPTQDADGFLSPEQAERVWQFQNSCGRHMTIPKVVYITNTNELGGVWTRKRFDDIVDWAKSHNLKVFLDGARLASALTSPANDLTLPYIAERVDAFYLGGTKNGMLFGEAMVINDPGLRESFPFLVKERGGLMAKGRLLGVQFETAFSVDQHTKEELYWTLARNANSQALSLKDGLIALGFESYGNSMSNQQFFVMTQVQHQKLEQACGCEKFYTLDDGRIVARFVCSWATQDSDVEELLAFARGVA